MTLRLNVPTSAGPRCQYRYVGNGRGDRGADGAGRNPGTSIDEMLDRAVAAINSGDRATASALAGQVLAADGANPEAEELLSDGLNPPAGGVLRRLTLLFVDLVDSTVLSTR